MTETKKTRKLRVVAAVLYVLLAVYYFPSLLNLHIDLQEVLSILTLQRDALITSTYSWIYNLTRFAERVLIAAGLIWGRRDRLGRILISAGAVSSLLHAALARAWQILSGASIGWIIWWFVLAATEPIIVLIIASLSMRSQAASCAKGFWYALSIWVTITTLLDWLAYFQTYLSYKDYSFLNMVLFRFLCTGAVLCATAWMAFPDGFSSPRPRGSANAEDTPESEGYFGLVSHVLLLLCTFGIWQLIWIYRTTKYTNLVRDEPPRNPATKLLLCLFIPFYSLYWTYKSAQRIDKLARSKGIPSDLSVVCLILAIFIGLIPPILMQSKINSVATTVPVQSTPQQSGYGTADELKQYKELLDSGVITQEEFDAKKKQLLGL